MTTALTTEKDNVHLFDRHVLVESETISPRGWMLYLRRMMAGGSVKTANWLFQSTWPDVPEWVQAKCFAGDYTLEGENVVVTRPTLVNAVVGVQCIPCGHSEVPVPDEAQRFSCIRCGSFDVRLFEADMAVSA